MSFLEMDVQEVMEGFPPPSGMSKGSKVEVVRRLDELARRNGRSPDPRPALARRLDVTPRSVERYRREIRDANLG